MEEEGEGTVVEEAAGVKEAEEAGGEAVEVGREVDGTKEDKTDMEIMEDMEGREDDTSINLCSQASCSFLHKIMYRNINFQTRWTRFWIKGLDTMAVSKRPF